ncbi:MAG: ice-binding family protein [Balneolales bacterium]
MKTITIYKQKFIIPALFLVAFATGCSDQTVGVEGYCPVVQSTFPANSATNVELDAVITVTFTDKVDPTTITPTSFILSDNSQQAAKGSSNTSGNVEANNTASNISGELTYDDSTNTMSFTPDDPLTTGTVYTGTVTTDVQDPIGNAMLEDYVWTFTTDDAPQVESTDPANEELGVAVNKIVNATFTQAMDPSSLDQTSFTLFSGNTQINGSVSYINSTVSFVPDNGLMNGVTYTATINTGAKNENGTSLQDDYIWSFSTETEVVSKLGSAETYGLMATSAITNIGNTVINGDVSLDPGTSMTGFPPGEVNGTININNTESAQAREDLLEAYNYYKNLPPGTTVAAGADLGALYPNGIAPGTYTSGSTMLVSTPLVLDAGGDPNAVWVFQIGSSLTTEADITLANGANENNVFWVPTEDATIGVGTLFHGTIVSGRDVTAKTGAVINGRILSGAITAGTIALDDNMVNVPGFQ